MRASGRRAELIGVGLRVLLGVSLAFGAVPAQALAEAADGTAGERMEEVVDLSAEEGDGEEEAAPTEGDPSGEVAGEEAADEEQGVAIEGEPAPTEADTDEEGEAPAAEEEDPAPVAEEPAEDSLEEAAATDDAAVAVHGAPAAEEPLELTAQVTKAYSISNAKVASVATQRWTSKAITPRPTVKYGNKTLKLNSDYTLSYKNNVKPGTATITVTGKGSYTGSRRVTFTIKKVGTWRHDAAGWRYVYAKGVWAKGKFLKIDGKVYRFDKDGYMLTGWKRLKADGKWWWYYFGSDGARRTGWQSVGGKWYWFDRYGRMATGFRNVGGKRYYLGSDGAMRTGWQRISKRWYYFYGSGAMAKSCWVGDYYVGKSGAMLTNTITPDGYRVLSSGRWDGKGKVGTVSTAAFSVTLPSGWGSSVSTGAMDRFGYRTTSVDNLVVFHWARNSDYTGYTSFRGGMMRIATKKGPTYTVDVYMTYSPWGGEAMEHHTPDSSDNAAVSKLTGGKFGSPSTFGTTQFDASMQYAKQYVKKNIADKLVVK